MESIASHLNLQPLCIEFFDSQASFELKSSLIQLLPTFHDLEEDDSHKNLKKFHMVCSSMKPQGITKGHIKLQAFPFSLANVANCWFYYLPSRFIDS